MAVIFSILIALISSTYPTLPLLDTVSYISNDAVRAERAISPAQLSDPPIKTDIRSLGPVLSAQSAIVVDAKSGAVLFEKNANTKHPIASITKLESALIFLDTEPDLTKRVAMREEDDREGGEDFIRPGQSATLHDYLRASLLGSANNATMVLSRSTGSTTDEFVGRMNKRAGELGMNDTVFVEPSGLDPGNVSTARDLVKLLDVVSGSAVIREITGTNRASIRVLPSGIYKTILTTNHLMGSIVWVEYGKTGYLDESRYNLATAVSTKQGNTLYIVALGSETNEDRVQDAKNLAVWAGDTYSWE